MVRRERFVDLGRSPMPQAPASALGTLPHPYVVRVSVSGPHPYLAVSTGSGHLGSGRVLPLQDAFLDRELDPRWAEEFDGAGAWWAIELLRSILDGVPVDEARLVKGYRRQHGADPLVEVLPIP